MMSSRIVQKCAVACRVVIAEPCTFRSGGVDYSGRQRAIAAADKRHVPFLKLSATVKKKGNNGLKERKNIKISQKTPKENSERISPCYLLLTAHLSSALAARGRSGHVPGGRNQ